MQYYGAMQTLPRKIMEQCRLGSAKLWSNADFAPQNHGDIVSGGTITTTKFP